MLPAPTSASGSAPAARPPPPPAVPTPAALDATEPEPPTPVRFRPEVAQMTPGGGSPADVSAKTTIYTAVYSNIPVFECMVRGIAVMRRRSDAWMNATQILKVAGIEKGKRTKILEKDVIPGEGPYEKVQGGYGKYQGTWLPIDRALDLATQYGVQNLLAVLFDPTLSDEATVAALPTSGGRQATPSKPRPAPRVGSTPQPRQITLANHPAPPPGMAYNPMTGSPFQPAPNMYHQPLQQPSHGGALYPGRVASQSQMAEGYPQYYAPQQQPFYQYPPQPMASSSKRPRDDGEVAEQHRMVAAGLVTVPGGGYQGGFDPYANGDAAMGPPSKKKRPTDQPPYQGAPFPTQPHLLPPSTPTGGSRSASPSASASIPEGLVHSQGGLSSDVALDGPPSAASRPPVASSSSVPVARPNGTASSFVPSTSALAKAIPTEVVVPYTRFASKPAPPTSIADPAHQRALLLGFFDHTSSSDPTGSDDPVDPTVLLPNPSDTFDPNLIIDPMGHTALHWACSLSRPHLVSFLLARGADPHRGNYAGETALIRSVLATNNFDGQSFPSILECDDDALSHTLRTLDREHRTVLHHIALVAGVKGRAASARYYLEAVLEWIARKEGLGGGEGDSKGKGFRTIVDIVDSNGDTALNIAARVGNRSLVQLLLSVQADKSIANKLGLRAGDYGIEEDALRVSSAEEAVSSLRNPPEGPIQKSKDVIADLTKTIESLNASFLAEIAVKHGVLTTAEDHLRGSVRTLRLERLRLQDLETKSQQLDTVHLRIDNVKRALATESTFDWSGRGDSTTSGPLAAGESVDPVRQAVGRGLLDEVVELRRMEAWMARSEGTLEAKIDAVGVASAARELVYKKVIGLSSNVPFELVESMLDKLVMAIQADGEVALPENLNALQRLNPRPPTDAPPHGKTVYQGQKPRVA